MQRMIIVDAAEEVACPKCAQAFALSEGISRQAIERHAEDFDRSLAERARKLEAELATEARRRAEREDAERPKTVGSRVRRFGLYTRGSQTSGQAKTAGSD
jgi:hypothetical protein